MNYMLVTQKKPKLGTIEVSRYVIVLQTLSMENFVQHA